jgi:glycosyltransferase involved in cell wall biosynthesis
VGAYLRALVPAIVDAGHAVTVIANSSEDKTFTVDNGMTTVRHFRLPSLHWYCARLPLVKNVAPLPLRQLEWSRAFHREAARVAATRRIDVIEATEVGSLFLHRVAPLVIRLHGSELTFRKHSGARLDASVKWNEALEKRAGRLAAAITSPGQSQAEEICARRGWPRERIRVIPNPLSAEIVKAAQCFQRNGNDERIVLYTGRLAPVKGIETLLASAKLVHAQHPSIKFVLAGPWQMPHRPENYGLKLNEVSADGVTWIGAQTQSELINWYKRASIFIMPSFFESFGISVAEALAFELPVVASQPAAAAAATNDCAVVCEAGNSSQFAMAITQLFTDSTLKTKLQGNARQAGFATADATSVARQQVALYEEVARGAHISK